MFPTTNEEDVFKDGLLVIPFYEDPSPVLKALLCYCDPSITFKLRSSSVALVDVQKLAMKLPHRRMLDTIRQKVGEDEDMYLAAANIFTCPENEAEEMVDVGLVSQRQFDSLRRYRDECCAKAGRVAQPEHGHFTWMSPTYKWVGYHGEYDGGCNRGGTIYIANIGGKFLMRKWWWEYMQEARDRLEKEPWGITVKTGDFFDQALRRGALCKVCGQGLNHDFREFVNVFGKEVDNAVLEVDIIL